MRLTVKFQLCNSYSKVGDMVALFDDEELARSGANLKDPKAVAIVNQAGHFGYMSVNFQRKNWKNVLCYFFAFLQST
jgi:hypothetical protein